MNEMELDLQTLFTQLKSTLKQQFQDAEWLDDFSRSNLISKLEQLTAVIDGGIVFFGEPNILDQRLSDVNMNTSNSYLQNAVQLIRRYRSGMYSLYDAEPNATDTM
jgi:predicted metalloendopeptidase